MPNKDLKEIKLAICIVTWNSKKYLPALFESIFEQTVFTKQDYPVKISINVVDSGSADGGVEYLQKKYKQVHILKNTHNLGFCRSSNQAIRLVSADYYLLLNTDVVLQKNYIELLLKAIQEDETLAAVSGKLLRAHFAPSFSFEQNSNDVTKTTIIDSCGLAVKKNRRFINIGEGEEDGGQYNNLNEVFGLPATATVYKASALEQIKYDDEYLDENFFSYKDDIDLSWRLRIAGFKLALVPQAQAFHFRSAKNQNKKYSNLNIAKSYKQKNRLIRYYSYRNHFLCLIKNETQRNFFKNFFAITSYEFRKFIYLLFFDWHTLAAIIDVIKLIPRMRQKRKKLFTHHTLNAQKIYHWFGK